MMPIIQIIASFFAITPFIITVILFFYFSFHIKKYNKLISMYFAEGFTLIPLYSFYLSMGFFGSFNMAYYFSRLKKGKRVLFSPEKSKEITLFLRKINPEYTHWLDIYYTWTCIGLLFFFAFVLLSLAKRFVDYFIS